MKVKDFDALKITLASPEEILSWSHGEVKKAETINYRTQKAEVDGLMCERIFGPTKNYECYCGKYKKVRYKGIVCDKCGVEVIHKRVRRERLGHIKLAAPVTHVWFSYGLPNKLSLILGMPQKKLESVIYFARYVVVNVDDVQKNEAIEKVNSVREAKLEKVKNDMDSELKVMDDSASEEIKVLKNKYKDKKEAYTMHEDQVNYKTRQQKAKVREQYARLEQEITNEYKELAELVKGIEIKATISEEEHFKILDNDLSQFYEIQMGAEGIQELLEKTDLNEVSLELRKDLNSKSKQRKAKAIQRLRIIDGMVRNNIKPEWTIVSILPVISPELRPIIQLAGGRFATSDLNDLYRRVINRNNRLKRLMDLGAPQIILRNEKRMLQEAVDALIDNSHRPGRPVMNSRRQPYKSLADMLRGKRGRFRQNLLGKRVDYSGRSVIVSGPDLKLNECGIPNLVALELFKPFVIREIILRDLAPNIKAAKNFFEKKEPEVWDILDEVIKERPVLLNRAPTLHKQGIQAFYPILTEGNAIRINPLICKGFNADFDGDQMAVHVPLSKRAVEEARTKMMAKQNILLLADSTPVVTTDMDMVLGCYYLTGTDDESRDLSKEKVFANESELLSSYDLHKVALRDFVSLKAGDEVIKTTCGRVIFNSLLPEGIDFVNEQVDKGRIKKIIARCLNKYDEDTVANTLDNLKEFGFKYATLSGFSVGMDDLVMHPDREKVIKEAEAKDEELMGSYYSGLITQYEMKKLSQQNWLEVTDKIAEMTWSSYDENNPLYWTEVSGARAVKNPTRQISGIRGLILDAQGKIVDLPLKSNFKLGLNSFEYFVGSKSTRKGLADTALKTAESGYLTRRLVDVGQDLITTEEDCGVVDGGIIIRKSDDRRLSFEERIFGRWTAEEIKDPKTGKVILKKNEEVTPDLAEEIAQSNVEEVKLRSPLTCGLKYGICTKCYGYDLGKQKLVDKGVAVGVIAAQAMGEAATQLTLDTKHLAGRVGTDITQGLPRVEELFEARTPKGEAIVTDIDGKVEVIKNEEGDNVKIQVSTLKDEQQTFKLKKGEKASFKSSKKVKKNDVLYTKTDGGEILAPEAGQAKFKDGVITLSIKDIVEREYNLSIDDELIVEDGADVIAGTQLTKGSIDPKEILELRDIIEAARYVIDEVQKVYGSQGISINDKHVELIVRQMTKYVRVLDPGDSEYLHGELISNIAYENENKALKAEGKKTITASRKLVGITTSAIKTESFLSAASFQEQVRVLTDAALIGKVDYLRGLKENVIIGKLVPLGNAVNGDEEDEQEEEFTPIVEEEKFSLEVEQEIGS